MLFSNLKTVFRDVFLAAILLVGFGVIACQYTYSFNYAQTTLFVGVFGSVIALVLYVVFSMLEVVYKKKESN